MVVFNLFIIQFNHDLSTSKVPGTLYGMSESGRMDQEIFYIWFSNQFLKHAITCLLLLLMLDRHSSDFLCWSLFKVQPTMM